MYNMRVVLDKHEYNYMYFFLSNCELGINYIPCTMTGDVFEPLMILSTTQQKNLLQVFEDLMFHLLNQPFQRKTCKLLAITLCKLLREVKNSSLVKETYFL